MTLTYLSQSDLRLVGLLRGVNALQLLPTSSKCEASIALALDRVWVESRFDCFV